MHVNRKWQMAAIWRNAVRNASKIAIELTHAHTLTRVAVLTGFAVQLGLELSGGSRRGVYFSGLVT